MVMGEAPAGARSEVTARMPAVRTGGPLGGPEEEPRWGGGKPEGPARRTLCGPSSNPFSRNTGWVGLAAFSLEMHRAEKQKTPKAIEKYFCLGFRERL